jgi:hypothetical protein
MTAIPRARSHHRQPWRWDLRAERIRSTSVLWPWLIAALDVVLAAAATGASITATGQPGAVNPTTVSGAEILLGGGSIVVLGTTVVGVLALTGELRHGTLAAALVTQPNRPRWLGAKLVVTAAWGAGIALVSQGAVLAVGLPLLAARHAPLHAITDHVVEASVGTVAVGALAAVWGAGLGAAVRNQSAAVVVALVWTVVAEPLVISALPAVGRFLPTGATEALTMDPSFTHRLGPWAGLGVWVAWSVVLVVGGAWGLLGGDVAAQ